MVSGEARVRSASVSMACRFWLTAVSVLFFAACSGGEGNNAGQPQIKGVDLETKTLYIGALNDESGPAAAIGKPYAAGKRLLARQINQGGSGLLPDGWKIELIERDHGYNPQRSVQLFNEIRDDVLFVGTSMGTPNTLPLRPLLERHNMIAFPASLSSKMAENAYTPPLGAGYRLEAIRAMTWAIKQAGGVEQVKAGIIYQQDDYGQDGFEGWRYAAKQFGVAIVAEQTYAPGQSDFAAPIAALKQAGATHVLLTSLPSATGPILGTAAQLQYAPIWIGNTPAWIDRFFDPNVIPSAVFDNFHLVTSLPFWGEDNAFVKDFVALYEAEGKAMSPPDFYILVSYLQGRVQIEAFKRALQAGDVSRSGYMKALQSLKNYDIDGALPEPVDLSKVPYQTGSQTRVLTPDFSRNSWRVVSDYAAAGLSN